MGDPVGAAAHVKQSLKPDGCWLIVEPFANDRLENNLNPVGRIFYSASTFICTPTSRAQEVGACLGAQAGQARMARDFGMQSNLARLAVKFGLQVPPGYVSTGP